MMKKTNFDDLKKLHENAKVSGRGSKAYFAFCDAFFDGFPNIYETAKSMNAQLTYELSKPLILAELERITIGIAENNDEVIDILWIGDHETAVEALANLHELISGTQDLQLKLFPPEKAD